MVLENWTIKTDQQLYFFKHMGYCLLSGFISHQQSTNHRWCIQSGKVKKKYNYFIYCVFAKYATTGTYLFLPCRAKIINTTLALSTTKYLSKERDYIPWQSALKNLGNYILMFERTEVYGALQVSPNVC